MAQPTVKRKIKSVFATYRTVARDLAGNEREVTRTAFRGEEVDVPESEAKRLDALGAVEIEEVMARALNPTDVAPAPVGEPVSVSPPPVGIPPAGEYVTGNTGAPDTEPSTVISGGTINDRPLDAPGGTTAFVVGDKSVTEVADRLRSESPNATATVAAAGDDPGAAETLLEAERLVRDGDPRATVEKPLQAIIEREGGASS
jgi:hypothetical protein